MSGSEVAGMGAKQLQKQWKELKRSELGIAIAWLSDDEERGAIQGGTAIPRWAVISVMKIRNPETT